MKSVMFSNVNNTKTEVQTTNVPISKLIIGTKPKRFDGFPKKEVEHFYLVQKLGNEIITFLCVPEPFKLKFERFYGV